MRALVLGSILSSTCCAQSVMLLYVYYLDCFVQQDNPLIYYVPAILYWMEDCLTFRQKHIIITIFLNYIIIFYCYRNTPTTRLNYKLWCRKDSIAFIFVELHKSLLSSNTYHSKKIYVLTFHST
jgi:hypothetical protein